LDLGADESHLRAVLGSLPVSGFEVEISRVKKSGLDMCDFNVKLDSAHENHDHDMEYLHGSSDSNSETCKIDTAADEHTADSEHKSSEIQNYHNDGVDIHTHSRDNLNGGSNHHEHRNLAEILRIIEKTNMSDNAKNIATKIFNILAKAEAKAHGTDIENVHFHEVGAVDSIVDIVAAAVCLDDLNITDVYVPFLCEGRGTVRCQHGILPIPVPAVANIVQENQLQLKITDVEGELVTPTGAALVAAVRTKDTLPEVFTIKKVGMGAGKRNYERPSILRAMLIEAENRQNSDFIYKLETNIDDSTGEMLGYVMDLLLENGARDVNYTPVYMKKNRPAYLLTVICEQEDATALEEIIFRETTTIGIRRVKMERTVLARSEETVDTKIGKLRVKRCTLPDGTIRNYPEYESAVELAEKNNLPLWEVMKLCERE
jgi:uncharacterized protein (TIGR00299 family) protein